ncbi:Hypothetical protein R9X50_00565900 [Acrodontium crateriforme]|uniref:Uncharacterized protein n=1 Tax=Acrodontium crateriforme TaxID=150365 RepID=A0AAQ3RB26_9PEZI|nr:Hypothetical protein R9X50_00565900 [Acrodontium crateriforme]
MADTVVPAAEASAAWDGGILGRAIRPRNEATRERDVYRYLHPWLDLYQGDIDRPTFKSAVCKPQVCPDVTLNALTQLGALRLNARRCFATLVTSSVEYVLAESSRSLKPDLWIGTSSFPREEGLTTNAIRDWRKNRIDRCPPEEDDYYYTDSCSPHWYIISDVRQYSDIQERAFVKHGHGKHRFYFSVPLRDSQGSALGALTVIDDKPRFGVSAEEMTAMEDIANSISDHLDASLVRSQRQRSEKLIKALGLFNDGKESLRDWWFEQDDARLRKDRLFRNGTLDAHDQQKRANYEFGKQNIPSTRVSPFSQPTAVPYQGSESIATRTNTSARDDQEAMNIEWHDFAASPEQEHSPNINYSSNSDANVQRQSNRSTTSVPAEFNLGQATDHTFARASNLLREALHAEGVVFVDTAYVSTQSMSHKSSDSENNSSTNEELAQNLTSDPETSDSSSNSSPGIAKVNGFSTRQVSSITDPQPGKHFRIPRRFLSRLTKQYKLGKIFNFEENGAVYASSSEGTTTTSSSDGGKKKAKPQTPAQRDALRLRKFMPGARTIAFYPLWDDTHGRYRAAALCWSTISFRFFDPSEDITYLASFGHSMIAELSRLETLSADRAKTSFISSISHELRSPLHGILAGVEFLQESQLTPFQAEMTQTINMAGRTLLDTVNHVLDYSKITNFNRAQRLERAAVDASRHHSNVEGVKSELGVTLNVNLARLTEELVETVVSSFRFEEMTRNSGEKTPYGDTSQNQSSTTLSYKTPKVSPVSITVNIASQDNWTVAISPGSWTRIVTNIVSNALKYTKEGTISIRLDVDENTDAFDDEIKRIRLTVEDTGIGISEQFLTHSLYTPFKQEDSHAPGTGLGLSIVKQIVKDMGANFKISSQVGRGTRVVLDLDAKFVFGDRSAQPDPLIAAARKLPFDRLHLLDISAEDHSSGSEHFDAVCSSVLESSEEWVNFTTSSGPRLAIQSETCVYAIPEADYIRLVTQNSQQLSTLISEVTAPLLILGDSVNALPREISVEGFTRKPAYIHQPIGPRKLLRALTSGDSSTLFSSAHNNEGASPHLLRTQYDPPSLQKRPLPWNDAAAIGTAKMARPKVSGNKTPGQTEGRPSTPGSTPTAVRTISNLAFVPPSSPSLVSLPTERRADAIQSKNRLNVDPRTIMLVEDNEINMKLLVTLMQKQDLAYKSAVNGLEAVELFTANPTAYSLILMDMSMPVMDGFEATSKIRSVERKRQLSPCLIIALTGVTSAESRQKAMNSGIDRYFTKPIRMKQLADLVDEIKLVEAEPESGDDNSDS